MIIEKYQSKQKSEWDHFISKSKNGHFLFYRDYMEYHSDRFEDYSLLIKDDKNQILAVLPAHHKDGVFSSHQGLTYGGIITNYEMKTPLMLELFGHVISHLSRNGFTKILYKTIPYIYHQFPAEEDRYAIFRYNGALYRRNVLSVVQCNKTIVFQERRLRAIKKAMKADVAIRLTLDYESFWPILSTVLMKTHKVNPVHSLDEISYLANRFPENIKLWGCYLKNEMVAGVVIYETNLVARSQYISASVEGKENGCLDLLFKHLLCDVYKDKPFFDFGPSDEQNGYYLNEGLIEQKEGFGARAIVHDHYEIKLTGSV